MAASMMKDAISIPGSIRLKTIRAAMEMHAISAEAAAETYIFRAFELRDRNQKNDSGKGHCGDSDFPFSERFDEFVMDQVFDYARL